MYTSSTFFIKAQIPGITVSNLVYLFERELLDNGVINISLSANSIEFSNTLSLRQFFEGYGQGRYSAFYTGAINIDDDGEEYIVSINGNISRVFLVPAITASAAALIFLVASGFEPASFLFATLIFVVFGLLKWALFMISFPVYFTKLRNDIECHLQRNSSC